MPDDNAKLDKKIATYKTVVREWNKKDNKPEGAQRSFKNYSSRPPFLAGVISKETLPRVYRILDALYRQVESLGGTVNHDLSLQIRNEHVHLDIAEAQDEFKHEITRQEAQALIVYEDAKRHNGWASEPQIQRVVTRLTELGYEHHISHGVERTLIGAVGAPEGEKEALAGQLSLLPGVEEGDIVALTIADANDRAITLARVDGNWVLPEAGDYPAEAEAVTTLVTKIVGLRADRLVTQTSASHKRLKVAEDDFERRIDVHLADGTRQRLYVGNSPSWQTAHVRADGRDEVYLSGELTAQDAGAEATAWVDTLYLSLPREQVVRVIIENAQGTLVLEKEGDAWTLDGLASDETLDEATVNGLLTRVTSVSLLEPLGKDQAAAYGLDDPLAVVTVYTDDGNSHVLRVGAQDPGDKTYVVASSGSDYYVRVREFAVQNLVEYGRQDLLVPPPTPEPAEGPEAAPEGL